MSKKTHDLRLKVSEEEYFQIRKRADKLGLSVASYTRLLLLNGEVEAVVRQ